MQIHDCIKKNLKEYRKQLKMSQKNFADILGVKHSTVSSWETGKNSIDLDRLNQICQVFNIPIYKIIFDDKDLLMPFVLEERDIFLEDLINRPEIKELYHLSTECEYKDIIIAIKLLKDLNLS